MTGFDDRWRRLVDAARRGENAGSAESTASHAGSVRAGAESSGDRERHAWEQFAGPKHDAVERGGTHIDRARAARMAMLARTHAEGRARALREWRGLAVAAGLFLACLVGLAWSADALGFTPSIGETRQDIARLARKVPSTSFIPQPPQPAEFGLPTLAEIEPKLAAWPGAHFLTSIDDWFTLTQTSAEKSQ